MSTRLHFLRFAFTCCCQDASRANSEKRAPEFADRRRLKLLGTKRSAGSLSADKLGAAVALGSGRCAFRTSGSRCIQTGTSGAGCLTAPAAKAASTAPCSMWRWRAAGAPRVAGPSFRNRHCPLVNIERQLHVRRAKPPCRRSTPSAGTPAISASPRPCGGDGVEQGTAVAYDADAQCPSGLPPSTARA